MQFLPGALAQRLVETHHQRFLFAQIGQMLHVHHRRVRGKALAVTCREAFREVRQHLGAIGFTEAFNHQAGVVIVPAAACLNHFFFQQQRVNVDAVFRINPQNQLNPRQHGLREEGPELAVRRLQTVHQHLLNLLSHFGGVHVTRHVGQAVAETPIRVFAQEHADLVALLDLHNRHHGAEQLIHRGLEQVITGQDFQHLRQLFAQVSFGLEARTALDLVHFATDIRNHSHAFPIHRRGVQAHKAAFLDHFAIRVDLADRHVIRVRRAVHAARVGSLGERQQGRFTQVAHRIIFDTQVFSGQADAQQLGQAEERLRVIFNMAAVCLVTHHKLFITQEGEMVAQQPLQKAFDLGFFTCIHGIRAVVDTGQQFPDLGLHRLKVSHGNAHLTQNLLQLLAQYIQFSGVRAAVNLQVHQRLLRDAFTGSAFGQDFQQLALAATTHAQHGGLQGVDAVTTAVQLGTHRVHQERQIVVQHFNRSVG